MRDAHDIAAAAAEARTEILEDVQAGRIPPTVRSFGDLHDYVDANEYAGLCDDARRADWETEDAAAVQELVHQWIVGGGVVPVLTASQLRTLGTMLSDSADPANEGLPCYGAEIRFVDDDEREGWGFPSGTVLLSTGHRDEAEDTDRTAWTFVAPDGEVLATWEV